MYYTPPLDITGNKYNRLTAIKFIKKIKFKNAKGFKHIWEFKCDCGKTSFQSKNAVKNGATKSCGCLSKENIHKTHGLSKTRFYRIWNNMKERCNNPKNHKFYLYGGRGIKCLWTSFEHFRDDMYDSYLKHVDEFGEKQTTIDRIDGNIGYCFYNCRWATIQEQNNNTNSNVIINYNGENGCISYWARIFGFTSRGLAYRLKKYNNNLELAIKNKKYHR
jgi:hypothetical protein